MFEKSLPTSDRIQLADEELEAIDKRGQDPEQIIKERDRESELVSELVERIDAAESNKQTPKKSTGGAEVVLDRAEWVRLTRQMVSLPPHVNKVIKAIRSYTNVAPGPVSIKGSLEGWTALINYSLSKGIALETCQKITSQIGKAAQ